MEFTYNASALGAGGIIQQGERTTLIPSLASVALPPTGGEGFAEVLNYYSEPLAFSRAATHVYGRQLGNSNLYTTETSVEISDLRIFDKLWINQLKATVSSTRGLEDDEDHSFNLDVTYTGVLVAGKELIPSIDVSIRSLTRYQQLRNLLTAGTVNLTNGLIPSTNKQALAERFGADSPAALDNLVSQNKPLQGSIVDKAGEAGPVEVSGGVKVKHHKVFVPGLGTARFGELMIKPGRRRVNLLRISLGTNEIEFTEGTGDGGTMAVGSVEGNGCPVVP